MKRLILGLFMIFGMAVSVNADNANCIGATSAFDATGKEYMTFSAKENYEKVKKAVEEILQIRGETIEENKKQHYVKFLRGLEMLQKSDRCIGDFKTKDGMVKSILWDYEDKNNDEYYFYNSARWGGRGMEMVFENLLGKDLSGESGELSKLKIEAKRNSYSKGVWMESTGGEW